jgi:hypothetical protein
MRKRILPLAGILAAVLTVGLVVSQLADGTGANSTTSNPLATGGPLASNGDGAGESPDSGPSPAGTDALNLSALSDDRSVQAGALAVPDSEQSSYAADGSPAGGGTGGSSLPSAIDRQIIRTATIELTVDDVPGAVQRIETAAVAAGGFVASSSITIEQQPPPDPGDEQEIRQRGTVTIRVPAESYASVMSKLRGIVDDPGDVTSLTEDTSEVTEEYADLQARLRNLEATEAQYLELLARAESINDVLLVQDRLNSVRLEIEQVTGRIQLLDDLTSMATITTVLSPPPLVIEQVEVEPQQSWAREAWENAWAASEDVLEALGVAAITGGVVLVWLLIPGALLLGGWWVFTSRRGAGNTVA